MQNQFDRLNTPQAEQAETLPASPESMAQEPKSPEDMRNQAETGIESSVVNFQQQADDSITSRLKIFSSEKATQLANACKGLMSGFVNKAKNLASGALKKINAISYPQAEEQPPAQPESMINQYAQNVVFEKMAAEPPANEEITTEAPSLEDAQAQSVSQQEALSQEPESEKKMEGGQEKIGAQERLQQEIENAGSLEELQSVLEKAQNSSEAVDLNLLRAQKIVKKVQGGLSAFAKIVESNTRNIPGLAEKIQRISGQKEQSQPKAAYDWGEDAEARKAA